MAIPVPQALLDRRDEVGRQVAQMDEERARLESQIASIDQRMGPHRIELETLDFAISTIGGPAPVSVGTTVTGLPGGPHVVSAVASDISRRQFRKPVLEFIVNAGTAGASYEQIMEGIQGITEASIKRATDWYVESRHGSLIFERDSRWYAAAHKDAPATATAPPPPPEPEPARVEPVESAQDADPVSETVAAPPVEVPLTMVSGEDEGAATSADMQALRAMLMQWGATGVKASQIVRRGLPDAAVRQGIAEGWIEVDKDLEVFRYRAPEATAAE